MKGANYAKRRVKAIPSTVHRSVFMAAHPIPSAVSFSRPHLDAAPPHIHALQLLPSRRHHCRDALPVAIRDQLRLGTLARDLYPRGQQTRPGDVTRSTLQAWGRRRINA
ncbi:hypothetical protein Vafri_14865, partial [Volvox africanus]